MSTGFVQNFLQRFSSGSVVLLDPDFLLFGLASVPHSVLVGVDGRPSVLRMQVSGIEVVTRHDLHIVQINPLQFWHWCGEVDGWARRVWKSATKELCQFCIKTILLKVIHRCGVPLGSTRKKPQLDFAGITTVSAWQKWSPAMASFVLHLNRQLWMATARNVHVCTSLLSSNHSTLWCLHSPRVDPLHKSQLIFCSTGQCDTANHNQSCLHDVWQGELS